MIACCCIAVTFCGSLNSSGGSCSAARREAAAVARGSRHQGAGLAGRSSVADIRREELRAMCNVCGFASQVETAAVSVANDARTARSVAGLSGS